MGFVLLADAAFFAAFAGMYLLVARRRQRLAALVNHLAAIARRGLPLQTGLRMLARDEGGLFSMRIEKTARLIEEGRTPGDAFAAGPHAFPPIIRNLIRMGDRSGNLSAFLETLRISYGRFVRYQQDSSRVLVYPVVLSVFLAGAVSMVFMLIVPKLMDAMRSVGADFDLSKWTLLSAASQGVVLLTLAVAAAMIFGSHSPHWGYSPFRFARRWIDRVVLWMPGLRRLSIERSLRQVAVAMGLFLKAGATLAEAAGAAAELEINSVLARRLEGLVRHLKEGGRMSEWCRSEPLIPSDFAWFVETGEAGGALADHLLQAGDHYETRVRYWEHLATRTVLPIFILLNGAIVLGLSCLSWGPVISIIEKLETM